MKQKLGIRDKAAGVTKSLFFVTWSRGVAAFLILHFTFYILLAVPQAQAVGLPNPLGTVSIAEIIGRIIKALTGFAGGLALLMFIWGGFQWLTAAGNPEKIKKGRDILVWSVLGMIVMFGSYIIVRYILLAITQGTVRA